MSEASYKKWEIQLRKGFFELCVLVALEQTPRAYGLQILKYLQAADIEVNEGTLYPLLNRMQKNGWLESSWQTETDSGHPRRFYALSATGRVLLPQMQQSYRRYVTALDLLGANHA